MSHKLLPALLLLAACGAEPIDEAPGALVDAEPLSWCSSPPFAVLHGPGFRSWASPICKGDIARGAFSVGWNDPTPHRCAQWFTGAETEAEVLCVDRASQVDTIYFRNPSHSGACEEWTLSEGPWFIWRPCGFQPVSQEDSAQL